MGEGRGMLAGPPPRRAGTEIDKRHLFVVVASKVAG